MKNTITAGFAILLLSMSNCGPSPAANETAATSDASPSESIFPRGEQGPADFFTGNVYNYGLVPPDSIYTSLVGNVYFEPGARSNWHLHPAGQILIVTAGVGYHQIKGAARETIRKGDVIKCPPNTLHWHGASENESMEHVYIIPNTEKGIVEWQAAVTADEYGQ